NGNTTMCNVIFTANPTKSGRSLCLDCLETECYPQFKSQPFYLNAPLNEDDPKLGFLPIISSTEVTNSDAVYRTNRTLITGLATAFKLYISVITTKRKQGSMYCG
ncbi:hypothetical protein QZH41_017352, partial [Actinostola sp. cb2023]